jgi:hypothetical protein
MKTETSKTSYSLQPLLLPNTINLQPYDGELDPVASAQIAAIQLLKNQCRTRLVETQIETSYSLLQ